MKEKPRKYSDEEFAAIWNDADSVNDACRKMGRSISGGSVRIIKERALKLNLTKEHFSTFERKSRQKIPLEEILVENSKYTHTNDLRKRLIKEGILEPVCSAPFCPVPNPSVHPFTGESIALKLSLDHINGDNRDNRLVNLRLLCMHCHAETETWCGKGKVRLTGNGVVPNPKFKLCECGVQINFASTKCPTCEYDTRRGKTVFDYPDVEVIISGVQDMGCLPYAKTLGVSDTGLKKHLRRSGVDMSRVFRVK